MHVNQGSHCLYPISQNSSMCVCVCGGGIGNDLIKSNNTCESCMPCAGKTPRGGRQSAFEGTETEEIEVVCCLARHVGCAGQRCWAELWISIPGWRGRHWKALLPSNHTVQNGMCLLCSASGMFAAAGITCQLLAILFPDTAWTWWKSTQTVYHGVWSPLTFSTKEQSEVIINSFFVNHVYSQWLSHFCGQGSTGQS